MINQEYITKLQKSQANKHDPRTAMITFDEKRQKERAAALKKQQQYIADLGYDPLIPMCA